MSIKIVKTAKQVKLENDIIRKKSTCPECNYSLNLSSYHYERNGLFGKELKVSTYRCSKCGCVWEDRS